jgi:hypothetical protein
MVAVGAAESAVKMTLKSAQLAFPRHRHAGIDPLLTSLKEEKAAE